jgi:hypothetical protein
MDGKKIRVKFYSLKIFYQTFGMNWIPTRDIKDVMKYNHLLDLSNTFDHYLESVYWNKGLRNRDGSIPYSKQQMKNGKYYRITHIGLEVLYELFGIKDKNLKLVIKHKLKES